MTSDQVAPFTVNPTYMGNEMTPYINELGLKITATETRTIASSKKNSTVTWYYSCGGEIINIYGTNFSIAPTLRLVGNVSFSYNFAGTITPLSTPFDRTYTLTAVGATPYKLTWDANQTLVSKNKTGMATNAVVACTLLKVNITKAVLTYNGITADVALPDDATDWSTQLASLFSNTTTSVGTTSWFAYVSYQVNDPRQNLNNLDWPQGTVSAVGAAYNGTADAVNTGVTMTTSGKDLEDGKVIAADTPLNDPSYKFTATAGPRLSTAYIRNGPMVSPWELGCIHRGALWETINLGEYNKAAAINPLTGGGNYTDTTGGADPNAVNGGDANILDQVKMTARVQSDQKVSLKLQTDTGGGFGILNALFKKIHVGASYANGVRLYNTSATVAALPSTGNVTGDARIVIADLNLYTWNGVSWASGTKKVSDAYIYNTSNGVTYWDGATWQIWSANGSDLTNSATMVNDIKTKSLTFLTRANVVQSATLKNGTGGTQTSKRAKEEIIGKMINLTSIAQADYFTVIVLAQSIKDVGPGIFYKDLDMDGICTPTSTANEATLGADIDGDGVITNPTAIPEQINSTAAGFGKYTQYADEIIAEQKIRADVYRDPLTRKCTIIKMEYVEE